MVIGVDFGASNLRAGVVDENAHLLTHLAEPARRGDAAIEQITRLVQNLKSDFPASERLGLVCPGQVDHQRGLLLYPVNIPTWQEVPLAEMLVSATGLPTRIENDAVGACLAEGRIGRARTASSYLVLTLGTGVGTGVVIDGRVFRGCRGLGCEWGHLSLAGDDPSTSCGCGNPGCIESFCSATALLRQARKRGITVGSAAELCQAARQGEPNTMALLEDFAGHLATALHNYLIILQPQHITIGGGLAAAADLFLPRTIAILTERLGPRSYMLPPGGIWASDHPHTAGLIGAACLWHDHGRIRLD